MFSTCFQNQKINWLIVFIRKTLDTITLKQSFSGLIFVIVLILKTFVDKQMFSTGFFTEEENDFFGANRTPDFLGGSQSGEE